MIELLTIVYGAPHIELFRKAAMKSLAQPLNRKCFYDENTRWNICTDDNAFDFLRRTIDAFFPELELNFISRSDLRDYIDPIQSATIWQIKEAIKNKSKVILAPPDTIFGNGTIPGLLKAVKKDNDCVAVAHPRVLPSILDHDFTLLNNAELVELTWKHLHKSWSDAMIGREGFNFRAGGVQWEYVNHNIRGTHMLPSPYLLQFIVADLDFFQTQISFGSFDHIWSSKMLIPQGRRVYANSSEDAFIVEITDQHKNVPPIFPGDSNIFWRENTPNELTAAELEPNKRTPFYFLREQ